MLNAIEEACNDYYRRFLNDNIQYFCNWNMMLICDLQLIVLERFKACPVLPIQFNVSVHSVFDHGLKNLRLCQSCYWIKCCALLIHEQFCTFPSF